MAVKRATPKKAIKAKPRKSKKASRVKIVKRKPAGRSRVSVSAAAKRRQRARRPASGLELKIYAMLDELGIEYIKEHKISRCTVDIFIAPGTVIEAQGCYFHKHTCQKSKPENAAKDAAVRRADDRRFYILRKAGYSVAQIWECEVAQDPEAVKKFLAALGGK